MEAFKRGRTDFIVVFLIMFVGFLLSWLFQGNFLGKPIISWTVFIVFPITVYLSVRKPKQLNFIAAGTFVFGVVFALVLETLAEFNGAWHVVDLVFNYRFPGGASLDAILGYLTMTLLTLVIYEHFIDSNNRKLKLSLRRVGVALLPATCIVVFLFVSSVYKPNLLLIDHLYLKAGIAAVIPALILGLRSPSIYSKMAKIMPFFFLIYLVGEYFAVKFSWWTYPSGQYIGYVSIGSITFPFEELFFWMFFYAASLVAYYETWVDDGK